MKLNRDMMKSFSVRFGLLLMLAFAAAGCVNEDPSFGESENLGTADTGFLTFSDVHVVVDSDTDQNTEESPAKSMLSRADASNPTGLTRGEEAASLDDYRVVIVGRKSSEVFNDTYAELKKKMGEKGLLVPVDTYTITATSHRPASGGSLRPDCVQPDPSYGGEKSGVSVHKDEQVSVGTVVCKLQNIKITLSVAADLYDKLDLLASLTDEQATSIGLDKNTLSDGQKIKASVYYGDAKTAPAALRWDVPGNWNWATEKKDVPAVYFPVLNEGEYNKLHLSFTAKMNDENGGALIPMVKDITNLTNGQWRQIHVVLQYDTTGNLTFDAQVSALVQDETIDIIGNGEAGAAWAELAYVDPTEFGPSIRWADGSEVTESIVLGGGTLQNIVLRAPNGIQKVALSYSTTNPDMDYSKQLNTDDLCTSKGNPTLKSFGIPYGADLAGQQEALFELNKLAAEIGAYDGEYSFTFTVTDPNGLSHTQTLTFVVGKISLGVVGVGFDIDTVQEVSPEGTIVLADGTVSNEVNVTVSSGAYTGIQELWVSIISDTLTPMLGGVGIPETFNLCELDKDSDIVGTMTGFGFPCNDYVKEKQRVYFKISATLMGILATFPGDHEFKLRVVDASGEITKSIRLHVKE